MLVRIGNIFRALGILSFLVMCYSWFFTSDLQTFLAAKQLTFLFFSISILVWIITLLVSARNK